MEKEEREVNRSQKHGVRRYTMAKKTLPELTPRETDTLKAIEGFIAEQHYPPTNKEIATRIGLDSTFSVQRHIKGLIEKGRLQRAPGIARGLKVLATAPFSK